MEVTPRPIDAQRDLPAVADLLGRARASGTGIWHPGGIQWWLRELAGGRDDFEAFVWPADDASDGLAGFMMRDGAYVIAESDGEPTRAEIVDWATHHLREAGATEVQTSAEEGSLLRTEMLERGFVQGDTGFELMIDTAEEPPQPVLPYGFQWASLRDISDETFIEGHRAAWSDKRPSPYNRLRHEAVKAAPQFRPDLVTIALTRDGTVASYCIGWLDPITRTLEIEPLGTHRDYRRLHLATAVVHEVIHRAWDSGAKDVLVWNEPKSNPSAYGLYTGAGMRPRRRIADLTRSLGGDNRT